MVPAARELHETGVHVLQQLHEQFHTDVEQPAVAEPDQEDQPDQNPYELFTTIVRNFSEGRISTPDFFERMSELRCSRKDFRSRQRWQITVFLWSMCEMIIRAAHPSAFVFQGQSLIAVPTFLCRPLS